MREDPPWSWILIAGHLVGSWICFFLSAVVFVLGWAPPATVVAGVAFLGTATAFTAFAKIMIWENESAEEDEEYCEEDDPRSREA